MADEDEIPPAAPVRPKRNEPNAPFTHKVLAFRRIGKRWGVYKEVGDGRTPPCPHCGAPYTATIKVFIDRLIAFGGATGGLLIAPTDKKPPALERDYPGQPEFDEKEILPES
jgi:hypothetical protein